MKGKFFTIAYDIPHDSRRVRLANLLKSYGERVQLSVFECWLNPKQYADLKSRIERMVEPSQDSVRLYGVSSDVDMIGQGRITEDPAVMVL